MARDAYEIDLPSGKKVVFVELTPAQLAQAMKLSGDAGAAREFVTALEGLRLSIREIDGKKVAYNDLVGDLWDAQFKTKETMLLVGLWNETHFPNEEEAKATLGKARTISSGT